MALLKSIRAVSPLKQKERKTHEPARVQSHPRALEQFVKKKLYIYIFLSLHEKKKNSSYAQKVVFSRTSRGGK